MDFFEQEKDKYQQKLIMEYREKYPEETESLTDEEIAVMNPLSKLDIEYILYCCLTIYQRQFDIAIAQANYYRAMLSSNGNTNDKTNYIRDFEDFQERKENEIGLSYFTKQIKNIRQSIAEIEEYRAKINTEGLDEKDERGRQ